MTKKKKEEQLGELSTLIDSDGSLIDNPELKMTFKAFATVYENNLSENIYKTSIELYDEFPLMGSPSLWQKFLRLPTVRRYIEGFLDEDALKTANQQLKVGSNSSSASKVKTTIASKSTGEDNSNIVVMFLPQKVYLDE